MGEDTPKVEKVHRWAHETGRLELATLVCGCERCGEVCGRYPDVLMVIKGSHDRRYVNSGQLVDHDAEEFLAEGSAMEVYVAHVQPSTKGWPRPASPILRPRGEV